MSAPVNEQIRRKVIQLWFNGLPRDKIAEETNIGAGTVYSIISNYKIGLDSTDFDSVRELAVEVRKQGLDFSDLASHFRLYNYLIKSGASENEIESFIAKISNDDVAPEKVIELVNQLFAVSRSESIPIDQVTGYVREKLEQKKKIDDDIQQADAILQSKNVNIEAINEHSGHKTIVYHILSVRVIVGPNPVECETNLTHFCHPKTMKSLRNRDKMKDDAIAQLSAKMQQFEKRQQE